tara:strand:+ start:513 stop:1256 length:744 start_codon:yes stop_codon:yes gene_type:complete
MRTPRILCEALRSPSIHNTNIKQIQHLAKVLRAKPGDLVQLFDGKGRVAAGKIHELTKTSITFLVAEIFTEKNPYQRYYQAIFPYIKKENLIYLSQKLVEIGINSLVIFRPDNIDQSIAKKDARKLNERIEEAVVHACEQSGCNYLPLIKYCNSLSDALDCVLDEAGPKDIFVLDTIADKLSRDIKESDAKMISFITGPESGFSQKERLLMDQHKLLNYKIGNYILRAETAPIVALSKLHTLFGEGL